MDAMKDLDKSFPMACHLISRLVINILVSVFVTIAINIFISILMHNIAMIMTLRPVYMFFILEST